MIDKNTDLQNTTTPSITYSECYRLPFLSLYHADCMEIMKRYPDKYFDLAIVDPPYGIGAAKQIDLGNSNTKIKHITKDWDNETPTKEYFSELFRVSKSQIVWGGNYFIEHLRNTRCFIVWDKQNGTNNMADCELAWTSFDTSVRMYRGHIFKGIGNSNYITIHPTQKPIKLYEWILQKYAEPNQKLLDTHFGSGSIALAVDRANRLDKMNLHLTACEIDKEYIDKAIKRISDSIKQGTLPF